MVGIALALLVAAAVLIAIRVIRAARNAIERELAKAQPELEKVRAEYKKTESEYGWIGHIHYYWWALGIAVAGLKFIYEQWKTAPIGSWERLSWGALLALTIALAMFAILKLLDRKLNGQPIREERN